jgi:flagellar biosynthesis/type III secretory pathway protein FliH
VRALLDQLQADNAVVDALASKDNPRLRSIRSHEREQGLEQGRKQGRKQGLEQGLEQGRELGLEQGLELGRIEAIESVCLLLDIELTPERRAHLRALEAAGLQRLREQLETNRRWPG